MNYILLLFKFSHLCFKRSQLKIFIIPLPFIKLWQGSSWLIPRPLGSQWSGAFVVTYNPTPTSLLHSYQEGGRGFLHQYFVDRASPGQIKPVCPLLLILFVSLFTPVRIICSLLRDYFGNILDRKNFSSRARCCRISILERFIMFLPQCAETLSTLGLQVAQLRFERHPSVPKLFFNMLVD